MKERCRWIDTLNIGDQEIKTERGIYELLQNYWKGQIEQVRSPAGAFKLMRWRGASRLESTALSFEGKYITDQAERANILRDSLLARHQADDDLPPCALSGNAHILWVQELN